MQLVTATMTNPLLSDHQKIITSLLLLLQMTHKEAKGILELHMSKVKNPTDYQSSIECISHLMHLNRKLALF
jgi:hypothetical protein